MAIKSILCIFGGSESELNTVDTALTLGKAYGASIRFLHISPDPQVYAAMYGCGEAYACAALAEACESENKERLDKAKQHIAFLAAKHQVPLDMPDLLVHHASAQFMHLTGHPDAIIGHEGRLCDLIVGRGIGEEDTLYDRIVLAALFNTGHAVLLMPAAKKTAGQWKDKVIALAWDGGLEASRALLNALPLLENAEQVHVLAIREHGKTFDLEAEQGIIAYLSAHGVQSNIAVIDREHHAIGEALLDKAVELKADLLVMGAYGHNRFREMMLGGVTDYMLECANIPLLLSH